MEIAGLFGAVTVISVPERGDVDLSATEWSALRKESAFWDLVDARVFDVIQGRGGRARLKGFGSVGRALCGDVVFECREKIPGALLALLQSIFAEVRTLSVPAPITDIGDTVALIVRAFVAEVKRYVGVGREWKYEQRRRVSSLGGGRLDVPGTVSLRARGLRHLMAFDTPAVTRAIEINQVIFAALREVEVIAKLVDLDGPTLASARAMSLFFDDCRDVESMFAPRSVLVNRVNRVRDDPFWSRHRLMVSLAGVLLSHGGLEPAPPRSGAVPLSWFVNLELLFERAVRAELVSICSASAEVNEGSRHKRLVFPGAGVSQANPDIVMRTPVETVIGDVKYKSWSRTASQSDLYQLLAHASAFNSQKAFLVYPSDQFDKIELGIATTGASVWLYAIDVRSAASGLRSLCSDLGVIGWE